MAFEGSLLDRISAGEFRQRSSAAASSAEDVELLMGSVQRNLVRLFNARHDLAQAAPDYGLPALSDLTIGAESYVERVRKSILVAVRKYEPRLRRVRVEHAAGGEDSQRLTFRVEGILVGRSGEHRVFYETSIAGSGQFDVSE